MTVVAVPYRPDFGHRDQLFTHLKHSFWNQIGFEVLTGDHDSDPFNRSAAVNQALAGDWEIAVIADADTWVPARQLGRAIETAKLTDRLVAAFNAVVEIDQPTTMNILAGKTGLDGSFGATKVRTKDLETQSSMLVITRDLWDRVGGMDTRFTGWGCEDNAFWHACRLHSGEPERIPGNAYHLWHEPATGKHRGLHYRRNLNLWRHYQNSHTIEDLTKL